MCLDAAAKNEKIIEMERRVARHRGYRTVALSAPCARRMSVVIPGVTSTKLKQVYFLSFSSVTITHHSTYPGQERKDFIGYQSAQTRRVDDCKKLHPVVLASLPTQIHRQIARSTNMSFECDLRTTLWPPYPQTDVPIPRSHVTGVPTRSALTQSQLIEMEMHMSIMAKTRDGPFSDRERRRF